MKLKFKSTLKYKIGIGTKFETEGGNTFEIIGYERPGIPRHSSGDKILKGTYSSSWTVSFLYLQFLEGNYKYLKGADNDYEFPANLEALLRKN